ncbi:MAG: (Fe-S)-binding protein [Candidatus Eisenbacteria bacterium]
MERAGSPTSGDLRACIRCGFCLEVCPTYRETNEEGLSARGRVVLLEALVEREARANPRLTEALDLCLLCGACADACPANVPYNDLLIRARTHLPGAHGDGRRERAALKWLRVVFERPRLLRQVLGFVRWSARTGLAGAAVKLCSSPEHREHYLDLVASLRASRPTRAPAAGKTRAIANPHPEAALRRSIATAEALAIPQPVAIFRGCVTPVFFPQVLGALESLLRGAQIEFQYPPKQGCCGSLHMHFGDLEGARDLARRTIDVFDASGEGIVLAESSGCAAALKSYRDLLAADPDYAARAERFSARVRDAAEVLWMLRCAGRNEGDGRGVRAGRDAPEARGHEPEAHEAGATRSSSNERVVLQDPCHLRHRQGIVHHPREVLDSVSGIERVQAPEADLCCGAAGIYNLLQPAMSARLGERKAEILAATGARIVVTADPGCRIQLAGRLARRGIEVRHLAEMCEAEDRPRA